MLRLSWRGVLRNWDRTLLGVAGMALAAAILTGALALPRGYPTGEAAGAAALIGGQVVVLAGQPLLAPGDVTAPAGSWRWRPLSDAYRTDLPLLFPDLPSTGILAHPTSPASLSAADVGRLAAVPGVRQVVPDLALPALAGGDRVVLRGREPAADAALATAGMIRYGRGLTARDAGRAVAVVDGAAGGEPGTLTLRLPHLAGQGPDGPIWDWGRLRSLTLRVVGVYAVPAGQPATVLGPGGRALVGGTGPQTTPADWPSSDVWVPAATWRAIWSDVAGGRPYAPAEVGLITSSSLVATRVALAAAAVLPADTALTVPELVNLASDRFSYQGGRYLVRAGRAPAEPLPTGGAAAVLGLVAAALVMAGNMLLLVASRRREIGILKALGASPATVAGMVAAETAGFALVGSVLGFVAVRAVVTLMLLASSAGAGQIVLGGLREGAEVIGLALGVAVVCGGLPALEAARVPAAAVLRQE